jgi:hypothetical protein
MCQDCYQEQGNQTQRDAFWDHASSTSMFCLTLFLCLAEAVYSNVGFWRISLVQARAVQQQATVSGNAWDN